MMERMILARLQWKIPKTNNIFGFVKDRSTLDAIVHLLTKITVRKSTKGIKSVFVAFVDFITLAELHAVKAALISRISRQPIHERVIINSDSMWALTIITTANFHTYHEIITEIYITASTLR